MNQKKFRVALKTDKYINYLALNADENELEPSETYLKKNDRMHTCY